MNTLQVSIPSSAVQGLEGWAVMIFRSTPQPDSVACVLYEVVGSLPTEISFGEIFAYASSVTRPYRNCQIFTPGLFSSSALTPGVMMSFTGSQFVSKGPIPDDFSYAIRNDSVVSSSLGLAQNIEVNAKPAKPSLNLQTLAPQVRAFFPKNLMFWIGVGKLTGTDLQPGLVLSTSIVQPARESMAVPGVSCAPMLGPFSEVDFSQASSLTATYQQAGNSFSVVPS